LDETTKFVLEKGKRNVEILKQGQNSPLSVEKQVAIIYCGTKGLLSKIPVDKIKTFEEDYLKTLEISYSETLTAIRNGNIGDDVTSVLETVAKDLAARFN
jgi:F-type H+-transporting ATPase subunit alpha